MKYYVAIVMSLFTAQMSCSQAQPETKKQIEPAPQAESAPAVKPDGNTKPSATERMQNAPEAFMCKESSECELFVGPCNNSIVANRTASKLIVGAMQEEQNKEDCVDHGPRPVLRVGCVNERCATVRFNASKYADVTCKSVDECQVIPTVCGQFDVVHKSRVEPARKEYDKLATLVDCIISNEPAPTARCDGGYCLPELPTQKGTP